MELRGNTAIVTGGAVRLGRELALGLAEEGVHIVLHYNHSSEDAQQTSRETQERGARVLLIQADFEDSQAAARRVVEAGFKEFGSVAFLINSAATFESASLSETTVDLWDRHFAINLKTPFFLAQEFAGRFEKLNSSKKRRGQILNILDWRATHPAAGKAHLAYTLAKSGLAALTQALAVELGPGIQVNGIAPGAILPPPGKSDEHLQTLAQNNPLGRVGSPADIVRAAVYLLKSDFITGEILHVNGGEHLPA
jgi:NAD(P)-dependent dehydrogenase (short-subunit alcohol dehydrogenase family)